MFLDVLQERITILDDKAVVPPRIKPAPYNLLDRTKVDHAPDAVQLISLARDLELVAVAVDVPALALMFQKTVSSVDLQYPRYPLLSHCPSFRRAYDHRSF